MGIYLDSFRKKLQEALDSKLISMAELHRRTGISTSMFYRYLKNSEPGLASIEIIAEAMDRTPLDLIDPGIPSIQKAIDLETAEATSRFAALDEADKDMILRQLRRLGNSGAIEGVKKKSK